MSSTRKRFLVSGIAVLLLLAAGSSAMAQRQMRQQRMRQPQGVAPLVHNERLQQELGLSAVQVERLRQLHTSSSVAAIENRARLQIRQLELRDLLAAGSPDRAAIDRKIQEISGLQATQMRSRIDLQLALRGILTPEQTDKLKELRQRALRNRMEQGAQRRFQRGPTPTGQPAPPPESY